MFCLKDHTTHFPKHTSLSTFLAANSDKVLSQYSALSMSLLFSIYLHCIISALLARAMPTSSKDPVDHQGAHQFIDLHD